MSFNWKCPFCNQNATITDDNFDVEKWHFDMNNKYKRQYVAIHIIVCPNDECKEYSLEAFLGDSPKMDTPGGRKFVDQPHKRFWQLVPRSLAKVFPDYVPKAIRDDYEEACLICDLSPKASATLARRCLQGMIRDFWKIQKKQLFDAIAALEEKVDPLTWQAVDAVREIGNIGAHMKQDINLIIDVDPDEASKLIGLIEILIEDWYIARHEKKKHLQSIIGMAKKKKEVKTDTKQTETQ